MAINDKVTPQEADKIAEMLRRLPLPRVHNITGRSYLTLARIAKAVFG